MHCLSLKSFTVLYWYMPFLIKARINLNWCMILNSYSLLSRSNISSVRWLPRGHEWYIKSTHLHHEQTLLSKPDLIETVLPTVDWSFIESTNCLKTPANVGCHFLWTWRSQNDKSQSIFAPYHGRQMKFNQAASKKS